MVRHPKCLRRFLGGADPSAGFAPACNDASLGIVPSGGIGPGSLAGEGSAGSRATAIVAGGHTSVLEIDFVGTSVGKGNDLEMASSSAVVSLAAAVARRAVRQPIGRSPC